MSILQSVPSGVREIELRGSSLSAAERLLSVASSRAPPIEARRDRPACFEILHLCARQRRALGTASGTSELCLGKDWVTSQSHRHGRPAQVAAGVVAHSLVSNCSVPLGTRPTWVFVAGCEVLHQPCKTQPPDWREPRHWINARGWDAGG